MSALSLACQDATGPTHLTHPIVGTYSVKATMDSVHYRGPCSPPSTQEYCYFTVPVGGLTLAGTLVIGDSIVLAADSTRLPLTSSSLSATSCSDTACSQSVSLGMLYYTDDSLLPSQVDNTARARLFGVGVNGTLSTFVDFRGTFTGDSIVGTVAWTDVPLHTYQGTFVARRR